MLSLIKKTSVGVAALFASALLASAEVKVGQPFPALENYRLEGQLPAAAGRVVLVDFWATWCAPCRASFPAYSALQRELGDRGFTIIAVSVDKKQGEYDEFLKKFTPSFTAVRDGQQRLAAELHVPSMPTSYLVDKRGVLRAVHSGFHGDASVKELRNQIIELLEEKP
ncbi:MAG: TlpA family protein disulfide reductase [Opitutae bacterium]|nr:TlpA family protein disulfide reductase [Opitutae bacterium]